MVNTIYWCPHCKVPIIKNRICPLCGSDCKSLSTTGVCNPVFLQERKLLSYILGKDLTQSDVWYLGSSCYLVDGERMRLPYIGFIRVKSI